VSREDVDVVRQPIAVAPHSHRRLEQHLVRFPRALALFARVTWRLYLWLPARSRLRQAIARRYVQHGFEAQNRGDLEAAFAAYHPNVESIWDARLVGLGFEPVYRGLEARLEAQRRWMAEWAGWRSEPEELIDLGDGRFLILGHANTSGLSSGAPVADKIGFLMSLSAGRVIREQIFYSHGDALEAAGLGD
jgi:ketosteroid isomerase-like protein